MSSNTNTNKGDDCLYQSEMEVENSASQADLTEDQLLASSHEDLDTGALSTHSTELEMDDNKKDGVNVISKAEKLLPNKGSDSKSGPEKVKNQSSGRSTLTRGQRKQLKALRERGVSRPEALSKILGKEEKEASTSKRGRNDLDKSTTPVEQPKEKRVKRHMDPRERAGLSKLTGSAAQQSSGKPQKAKQSQLKGLSYSDMASRRKVGVTPKDYPNTQLSTTQLDTLQEALLLQVEQQRNTAIKPKFCNLLYRSGYMVLVCKDQQTAEWVKQITPKLHALEGVELVALDEDKIPRPELLRAFFPQSAKYSDDRIKALIESQNDLTTTNWRILQRSKLNDIHVEWIFTVDGSSMDALNKSELILNYRFGETQIRKVKSAIPRSSGENTERLAQEKSEEAFPKPKKSVSTMKASLSTPKGRDSCFDPIPSSSGVNKMIPNKGSGLGDSKISSTKGNPAGQGGQIDKIETPERYPKTKLGDPQHPNKDGNRPGKCGKPDNV